MSVRVGIAEVDWTPPAGLPLMGNVRTDYAAKGVHDPLRAKAAVFHDARGRKLALLSVDVCMLHRRQVALMRDYIAGRCNLRPQEVLIAATHIHSGPATVSLYGMPKADDEQIERFLRTACEAVVLADRDVQPASLRVGLGRQERLSFCRRLHCKDGVVHMNWEDLPPDFVEGPAGPIDPQVGVLVIERDAEPRAVIVNFALHPAILDYENQLYSAGYPGCLAEAMSRRIPGEFTTLFFNGCCGDLNHINHADPFVPRRGYAAARRTGYMLADVVKDAMDAAKPAPADMIAVCRKSVTLKRFRISEEQHRWAQGVLDGSHSAAPAEEDGLPEAYRAATWVAMYEAQGSDDHAEVMAARIGEIGVVGLPGEVFCELGLEIKVAFPARHTFVFELANDAIGYLPMAAAFNAGGYETTPGATLYDRNAGQALAASARRQLEELFRQ